MRIMERQNRFDEAMKAKLGQLEDEPSARVWAGVRASAGPVMPPQRQLWPMRVAAAITLLCSVGVGYYLWTTAAGLQGDGKGLPGTSKARQIVVEPLDREGRKGTYLAEEQPATLQAPAPGPVQRPRPNSYAQSPQQQPQQQPDRVEAPQTPAPVVADQERPKQAPQDEILVPRVPDPQQPHVEATAPAIAAVSQKRSIKLPTRDELGPDLLKRKSGAILGAVTNGASSFLGLDANYEEHAQEDQKLIAFNADFGLFKIKKVKSVKQ